MLITEYRYFTLGPRITIFPSGRNAISYPFNSIVLRTRHQGHVFPYPIASVEDLFDGPTWLRVNHGFHHSSELPAILHQRRKPSKQFNFTFVVEMTFDDLMTLYLSL